MKEKELPELNKIHIQDLERKAKDMERKVNYLTREIEILNILIGKLAFVNGLKIERYQNGLMIISELTQIG